MNAADFRRKMHDKHRKEYEALFAPNTKFKVEDFDWVTKNIFASILTEVE